ncbi:MAG: hypothetical protein H0V85_00235 [Thermoleophilaceae bacterium]|nr:hypothetical protein [Thermoleophilaceae bacterium]
MPRPKLVRAVFGVLLLATVGAFSLTQWLKSEPPAIVTRFIRAPKQISPGGDGLKDSTRVGFRLRQPDEVRFSIVDAEGGEVRRLVDDRRLSAGRHVYTWDARDGDGETVPDGRYGLQVALPAEGRTVNSIKRIKVDSKPPRVKVVAASPEVVAPGEPVEVRYRGPRNFAPLFKVFRTTGGAPVEVARFKGDRSRSGTWDGRVRGEPARDGTYAFSVTVRDRAGNSATAPGVPAPARTQPGTGGGALPGSGVTVSSLAVSVPPTVVRAGHRAAIEVGPKDGRFEFTLRRIGARRALRSGSGRRAALPLRIPGDAATGLYLLRVRRGSHLVVAPVAIQRRGPSPARPLVVLPAIAWEGLRVADDDANGFPDTLEDSQSVAIGRPEVSPRAPAELRSRVGPLLDFFSRERLPFDLTTDIELARGEGPKLDGRPGVVFPGTERWLPVDLQRRLRDYVEDGGDVVSFGTESFRRTVAVGADRLSAPGAPQEQDAFGEATRIRRTRPAPLRRGLDELGLFGPEDRFVGSFETFEESLRRPDGAEVVTAAGRDDERPALVAYRLGKGNVIRIGVPGWGRSLTGQGVAGDTARVTRRILGQVQR